MEKLTIEQKAKRYDEVVNEIKNLRDILLKEGVMNENGIIYDNFNRIFPELNESDDEKIRGAIIHFISHTPTVPKGIIGKETMISWLERQNKNVQGKSAFEAIKEETVDNANKVEAKFKVGDWVVRKDGKGFHDSKTIQFTKTDENACQFGSVRRLYEDKIRHWTIADAQDGDVLVASDGSIFIFAGVVDCACKYYITLTATNDVKINKEKKGGYWETSRAVYPATKKQRHLLFQKMKEAGYEWDDEKKELKKI